MWDDDVITKRKPKIKHLFTNSRRQQQHLQQWLKEHFCINSKQMKSCWFLGKEVTLFNETMSSVHFIHRRYVRNGLVCVVTYFPEELIVLEARIRFLLNKSSHFWFIQILSRVK